MAGDVHCAGDGLRPRRRRCGRAAPGTRRSATRTTTTLSLSWTWRSCCGRARSPRRRRRRRARSGDGCRTSTRASTTGHSSASGRCCRRRGCKRGAARIALACLTLRAPVAPSLLVLGQPVCRELRVRCAPGRRWRCSETGAARRRAPTPRRSLPPLQPAGGAAGAQAAAAAADAKQRLLVQLVEARLGLRLPLLAAPLLLPPAAFATAWLPAQRAQLASLRERHAQLLVAGLAAAVSAVRALARAPQPRPPPQPRAAPLGQALRPPAGAAEAADNAACAAAAMLQLVSRGAAPPEPPEPAAHVRAGAGAPGAAPAPLAGSGLRAPAAAIAALPAPTTAATGAGSPGQAAAPSGAAAVHARAAACVRLEIAASALHGMLAALQVRPRALGDQASRLGCGGACSGTPRASAPAREHRVVSKVRAEGQRLSRRRASKHRGQHGVQERDNPAGAHCFADLLAAGSRMTRTGGTQARPGMPTAHTTLLCSSARRQKRACHALHLQICQVVQSSLAGYRPACSHCDLGCWQGAMCYGDLSLRALHASGCARRPGRGFLQTPLSCCGAAAWERASARL